MEKILGLDLGTNSIGWAIRDTSETENQIIDKGVLIFDKGVATVEGKEQPKVKVRTESRGKRRNYQAEKYRKWKLLECLIENAMCPLSIDELNAWRHYNKKSGRKYPQSQKFIQWLRFDFNRDDKPDMEELGFSKHDNCYLFRYLAISEKEEHKKIFSQHPMLLGRLFYQMAQRRGFRKGNSTQGETKLIEEGRENAVTHEIEVVGISIIDKLINEKYKALGAALYWGQKNNELEGINNNRIRNRFTYRNYFENEVDLIFSNLGFDQESVFCKTVKHCIVAQRPLRSQKGLVGYCTLDAPQKSKSGIYFKSGKKRIPLSHPLYEEFRTWLFINNLKIEAPASVQKTNFLNNVVLPLFNRSTDFYFSDKKSGKIVVKGLKTKIEEAGGKIHSNYDRNKEEEGTRYNANTFQNKLEKIFGENWKDLLRWNETLNNTEKTSDSLRAEDIWHLFYDAIITKKQTENTCDILIPILQKHFPEITFDKKHFENFPLDKGYASLSAASIRKILPYLKQGMIYSQAVFLANLGEVFNTKLNNEQIHQLTDDFHQIITKHKADKEIYSIVNNLISDRLYYRDRLNMGEKYLLDSYDLKDIKEKIMESFNKKSWDIKTEEQKKTFTDSVSQLYELFLRQPFGTEKSKFFLKLYRIEEALNRLLIEKYQADPKRILKYLWHPSEQEKYAPASIKKDISGNIITDENGKEIYFLGDPNPISKGFKNPMAMKTLQILKKHLNYLLQKGKIDATTKIVIEIARELNDANKRRAIEKFQGENRRNRDGFKKLIEQYFKNNNGTNRSISEDLLDRYQLWQEQSKACLYCGQPISCQDIINGTAQLEHTIPVKLSNCDELFNLTIAHPQCNKEKAKRFPTQWKEKYENIKYNVRFIYANYKKNEATFKETFESIKYASDKEAKDRIIIKRHYHKMHLDYWRKKYETFTIEEITSQFRRQQLTDTQIITKYALPYLKTVFARVDVQKGSTTAKFRKIFQIEPKVAEKDRSEHTHHYTDAAVLTLIPPASIRDKMIKEYNEAIDMNTLSTYVHPKPRNWNSFHQALILSVKNEIIINHFFEDRALKQSFKYLRKRGKLVKNQYGNKIIQTGSTIRGKLHDESIFGMIKMPETEFKEGKHRLKIIDKKLCFIQNDKRKDPLFVVKKIRITDIKNVEDFEKIIIDPNLAYYLKTEVEHRMKEDEMPLEKALQNLYAFGKRKDKNGNPIQPIRHVRCLTQWNSPVEIKAIEKAFLSKRSHKQVTYANNGETPACAIYEWFENEKFKRKLEPITLLEMSKAYHRKIDGQIIKPTHILYKKQLAIFYDEKKEELKDLYKIDKKAFAKRIYKVLKFEDGKIYFDYHLTSLTEKDLFKEMERRGLPKKGDSRINHENPPLRLRLSQGALKMVIEKKHFDIQPDGEIIWKF